MKKTQSCFTNDVAVPTAGKADADEWAISQDCVRRQVRPPSMAETPSTPRRLGLRRPAREVSPCLGIAAAHTNVLELGCRGPSEADNRIDNHAPYGRRTKVVAMAEQGEKHRYGLLQSAMEELLERTRAVANLVGSVGNEALGAMPEPVPATVTGLLKSLQQLIEQAPPFTAEFDVLVEEIRAQRLTVQALQAELSAFDHQLDVLEKSLAPLESWAHQWAQLRQSVGEALHPAAPEQGPPAD